MTATTGRRPFGQTFRAGRVMRAASVGTLALALAVLIALVLALPGQTVTTKYLPDLFVLLDATHRVAAGQVPSRDFHTALGPLAHYIPALGYWITGEIGAALPVGTALAVLALAPAVAHVASSRLHPAIALPFAAFVLLVAAVPITLGEGVNALTFTRFYNRIGWAALATLLVMYLLPRRVRPGQDRLDAVCAAGLSLAMIYTKATYGLAALAFLAFLLLDPRQRRWAALALALVLAAGAIVEVLWRGSWSHVQDLLLAWQVDGGVRGSWGQIVDHVLGNLADYVLLTLAAALALGVTRSARDLVFYLFCAVAGFLIINQNFQAWGIVAIHAGAAVAAETILRRREGIGTQSHERWPLRAGAILLFLALVLPSIVHNTLALGVHAVAAVSQAGAPVPLPRLERLRLANLWTWGEHDGATEYLDAVADGAAAILALEPEPRGILVLDLANPFSVGLGAPPPRGDAAGLLWDRTMDGSHAPAPGELLADVHIVMEPKAPRPTDGSQTAAEGLRGVYGPALEADFDVVRETEHWRIHRRRAPAVGAGAS